MLNDSGLLFVSILALVNHSFTSDRILFREFESIFLLWEKAVLTILKKNFSSSTSTDGFSMDFLRIDGS